MNPADIKLYDPDEFQTGFPHETFAYLRREDPVFWQDWPGEQGFWNLTKYEDIKFASKTPGIFSSAAKGTNLFEIPEEDLEGLRCMMLNMDPPQHSKYRRIVSKSFTPRMIDELRDETIRMARQIVDDVAEKGEIEFVSEVASLLPTQTIFSLMGVPECDQAKVFEISNRLIGFDDPDFQTTFTDGREAAAEMFLYGSSLADRARRCPANNLATALLHGKVDGEGLSETDYNYFFLLLMIAGNETTRTMTSHGMRLLMERPDVQRALHEDPSLVPNAVEEILRFNPAVYHFRRTVMEDVEIRDKTLKKGDKVLLWYHSANRDEEIFEDPDCFDIHRFPNEHLAFGVGEHYCMGAHLARQQLGCIFHELVTRLPEMEMVAPPDYLRGNFVDGIKRMRVRFVAEVERTTTAAMP